MFVEKKNRIWILESDQSALDIYKTTFSTGFETTYFNTLIQFQDYYKALCKKDLPQLLITSLSLNDGSFMEFFNTHKDIFEEISYYIVTDIDDLEVMRFFYTNKALGYYLKPIASNELLANIEWVLSKTPVLRRYDISSVKQSILVFNELTFKEQQIFDCLVNSKNRTCSREMITEKIWHGLMVHEKTFDVHLCNLRSKLSKRGMRIRKLSRGKYILENVEKYLNKNSKEC
jgi:DNA-binding response OmpR family regulator